MQDTREETMLDAQRREIGGRTQPNLWHPWLPHYGTNRALLGDGRFDAGQKRS